MKEYWDHDKMVEKTRQRVRSSAMICYTVTFWVNAKKGEPCNEFNSGFKAEDENGDWAIINSGGMQGKPVLSRKVFAESAYGACRKMEEWQQKGLPDSYLTETV